MYRVESISRRPGWQRDPHPSPVLESRGLQLSIVRPASWCGQGGQRGRGLSVIFHNKNRGALPVLVYNPSDSARASVHVHSSPYFWIDVAAGGALHERGLT